VGTVTAIIAAVLAEVAIAAGSIAHAEPPNSDTFSGTQGDNDAQALWIDARAAGLGGSVTDAAHLAQTICGQLISGEPEAQIIASSGASGPESLDAITFAVNAAEYHFCPQFYRPAPR
jgi:hypothetical protein